MTISLWKITLKLGQQTKQGQHVDGRCAIGTHGWSRHVDVGTESTGSLEE